MLLTADAPVRTPAMFQNLISPVMVPVIRRPLPSMAAALTGASCGKMANGNRLGASQSLAVLSVLPRHPAETSALMPKANVANILRDGSTAMPPTPFG